MSTDRAFADIAEFGNMSEDGGTVGRVEWEEVYPRSTEPEEDPIWLAEFCESMG